MHTASQLVGDRESGSSSVSLYSECYIIIEPEIKAQKNHYNYTLTRQGRSQNVLQ